jgi:hypothetical protein
LFRDTTLEGDRREKRIVLLLCALAALRVFLFSAAFPFFNNVDEHSHFDLVAKYARGHVPRGLEPWDEDVARLVVLYGSPEYFSRAQDAPRGVFPPPLWTVPPERAREVVEARMRRARQETNHESTQPPLYYAIAGLWYRLGQLLGLSGGMLLYWVRFMNVPLVAILVGIAHRFAKEFFPDSPFLRVGIPLVIAFFPQDVFYSVSNDVLLPLASGIAFHQLLLLLRGEPRSHAFHAAAGLLLAAALLVKVSNLPLLAVALGVLGVAILRPAWTESRKSIAGKCAVLALAAIPTAAWGVRNVLLFGDFAGMKPTTEFLGWSPKPLRAILDHPLFTPGGAATFWHETLASFWRGELVWGMEPIAGRGWDLFYSVSSPVLVAAAVLAPPTAFPRERRQILWPSLVLFALGIAFLAGVSVRYDFGPGYYPSRAHPYETSGRLALGALIPFVALYVAGLSSLLPGARATGARWGILVAVVALVTIGEVLLSGPAFASAYNWFRML